MNITAKLYKVAYILDQKGQYNEVKKIEEVMRSMAERVGLSEKDMVSLADYFDYIGDTVLADRFDDMLKESKKKKTRRPPKKWWDKMVKRIKKGNPDYSEERVRQTIGEIWFNNISAKKRKEILAREGKE